MKGNSEKAPRRRAARRRVEKQGQPGGGSVRGDDLGAREELVHLLAAAVHHTNEAVLITHAPPQGDHRILFVNPAFTELTGYTADEIVGQVPPVLQGPETNPDLMSRVQQKVVRGRGASGEDVGYRKDGTPFVVEWHVAPISNARGEVTHSVCVLRDISPRRRVEEEKEVLLDVARDIAGTLDFDELLKRVQRRTGEALRCDGVATLYWDSAREVFRVISHHGIPPDLAEEIEQLTFPRGVAFESELRDGGSLILNDVSERLGGNSAWFSQLKLSSMAVAALTVRGKMVGVLCGVRIKDAPFVAREMQLFQSIAGQLAVAIEAADLYQAQKEEAEIWAALAWVGQELNSSLDEPVLLDRLCRLTSEVVGCDSSNTFLWDEEEDAYILVAGHGDRPEDMEARRAITLPRPMIAKFLERLDRDGVNSMDLSKMQGQPLARVGLDMGLLHVMHVPLRRGREIVGLQSAVCRQQTGAFTAKQERMMRGIAQFASLALENARLVDQLAGANRIKSDFVATMSHELRTPLNVIVGYTDILLEEDDGTLKAEQSDRLTRIGASARELLDLINATLDLGRLEAGRAPLALERFAVADLVREIDTEIQALTRKPGVSFAWKVAPDLPELQTDPIKLKVVVKNLISNALKFTERGEVTVTVDTRDGGVEFCVTDTGVGISAEGQSTIFEAFTQGEAAKDNAHRGVGLGLYIVRRLLEMVRGTVTLESELGVGSTFHVWVPHELAE